ncbi:MAG TPA: hypothetical protein VKG92_12300 [Flavobacteriales bacterium]|nr:hypothetical protein [Flavobacteriales bacterium]
MKRLLLNLALSLAVLSAAAQSRGNEYLFIKFDDYLRYVEVFRADRDVERISMPKENRDARELDLKYVLGLIERLETEGWVLMDSDAFPQSAANGGNDRGYFWTMRKPKP